MFYWFVARGVHGKCPACSTLNDWYTARLASRKAAYIVHGTLKFMAYIIHAFKAEAALMGDVGLMGETNGHA